MLQMLPLYIWLLIFFSQPHKEERFLFVVYPLICFHCALSLHFLQGISESVFSFILQVSFLILFFFPISFSLLFSFVLCSFFHTVFPFSNPIPFLFFFFLNLLKTQPSETRKWGQSMVFMALFLFTCLGLSRIASSYYNYHSSLDIYSSLSTNEELRELSAQGQVNLCVGKEWYRFPSHFFLPNSNITLQFLKSDFTGQLPKYFEEGPNATWIIPTDMNDENLEEPSRYVSLTIYWLSNPPPPLIHSFL